MDVEESLGSAPELTDPTDNQIAHLPPEIGSLVQLRHLDLCNNRLESLPPEIGQLAMPECSASRRMSVQACVTAGAGKWGWSGVCGGRRSGVAGRACGRVRGS
jgi:hypothetical protein